MSWTHVYKSSIQGIISLFFHLGMPLKAIMQIIDSSMEDGQIKLFVG